MSWTVLVGLVLALAIAVLGLWARRAELTRMAASVAEREQAKTRGSHTARLQFPNIDLARCIGCGSCVRACPEEGVLDLVHGQAVVVHGARCVGHGRCAVECPVGAIAITLGDLESRRDIPALHENFESTITPGLFLAGEVTGHALVRTAVEHGTVVADEVAGRVLAARGRNVPSLVRAARVERSGRIAVVERDEPTTQVLDLVIVGAGPAGIACALQAKLRGLNFLMLEQDELGGTVAKYPRRKLVMTQPVTLPIVGRLTETTYSKEQLIELWTRVVREQALPLRTGVEFLRVERTAEGVLNVHTKTGVVAAQNVCLALGRRGTPRKLGVPGEELEKVAYSLLDAHSYTHRRILVVGGGDSAIEAAVGLAEQPGNQVTISYRKKSFFRLKARNEARLEETLRTRALQVAYESDVVTIARDHVVMRFADGGLGRLDNDDIFVFAGGTPPIEVLEASGVSFDPADRVASAPLVDQGAKFLPALVVSLILSVAVVAWVTLHSGYYTLGRAARATHAEHSWLRPSGTFGMVVGIAASALIVFNLSYLLRRNMRWTWMPGSLQTWMTSHAVTGILALLCAIVHSAMAPQSTVGGHALTALAILVVTGAIGRYFYAFVPRAANGRELAIEEVRTRLAAISSEWDQGSGEFGDRVRNEVQRLMAETHWQGSFFTRLRALMASERRLRKTLVELRVQGEAEGVAAQHLDSLMAIARRAQRTASTAAHYEDLRSLMASWRYFHRWVALGMVLLVVLHVYNALRYGAFLQ
jgi:dihydropyrimidine dehydrogenase (NAD+) subunit PreT